MKPTAPSLALVLAAALPHVANAADNTPSLAGSVVQMLFGLLIVLAALFGVLAMLRKLQGGRTHLVGGLKVIGAASVGPRERVVLVSLGSKVLVLGVTPGRVNALHTMEADELPPAPEPAAGMHPLANDFAARLRQLLEKRNAR